jgi:hypothetical protein
MLFTVFMIAAFLVQIWMFTKSKYICMLISSDKDPNFYEILNLPSSCSHQEIIKSYESIKLNSGNGTDTKLEKAIECL